MKTRTMYMLTLNGQPAGQDRNGYVYFAYAWGSGNHRVPLFDSLRDVRAAIARGREERCLSFPERPDSFRYGYQRVAVPVEGGK